MAHITLVAPDFYGNNALALRGRALAQTLAQSWQVNVITDCRRPIQEGPQQPVSGVRVHGLRASLARNDASFIRRIIGELWLGLTSASVLLRLPRQPVVITSPPFIVALVVACLCILTRRNYIFDVRDLYPEVYARARLIRTSSLVYRAIRALVSIVLRKATLVCTVTDGLAAYLCREYTISNCNFEVASNGYLGSLFRATEAPVAQRCSPVTIISHGNFGELFDVDLFARVAVGLAAQVKTPYRILLVGFGKRLSDIERLKLSNVEIVGKLPVQEVYALLTNSDIGLSIHRPYDGDLNGFPVKVFEFIGAGLPSVVVPMHEGGRLVSQLGLGYAASAEHLDELLEFFVRIIDDEFQRQAVRARVLSVRQRFSLEQQMEKVKRAIDAKFLSGDRIS